MKTAQLYLPGFGMEGSDFRRALQARMTPYDALIAHAARLQNDAVKVILIAEIINGREVHINPFTHYVDIMAEDENILQALCDADLAGEVYSCEADFG